MIYSDLTFGSMEAIVKKLGGRNGVEDFLSGKTIVKKPQLSDLKYKTLTIELGFDQPTTIVHLTEQIQWGKLGWGRSMVKTSPFKISHEKRKVELVIISEAELGFEGKPYCGASDLYKRAAEFGLELCPPDLGLQLRLQYKKQPEGEFLRIAMKSLKAEEMYHGMFCLGNTEGKLWFDGFILERTEWGSSEKLWVFIKPNEKTK